MNGYSELLLTMGALIIFGLYAMQANKNMSLSDTWSIENETQLEAVKISESIIHQAAALPFDRVVISGPLKNNDPNNLTRTIYFGMDESGNSLSGPKDKRPVAISFDDFHGHNFREIGMFGEYTIKTTVSYLNSSGNPVPARFLRKRLTVEIDHKNFESPILTHYTKSYH